MLTMVDGIVDRLSEALARSQNPDRIIAFVSVATAWLAVTVLRALVG